MWNKVKKKITLLVFHSPLSFVPPKESGAKKSSPPSEKVPMHQPRRSLKSANSPAPLHGKGAGSNSALFCARVAGCMTELFQWRQHIPSFI